MQRYEKSVIYAKIPHFILVKNTKFNSLIINILHIVIDTTQCNCFCSFTDLVYKISYRFINFT